MIWSKGQPDDPVRQLRQSPAKKEDLRDNDSRDFKEDEDVM